MSDYTIYDADINVINAGLTVNKNNNTTCYDAICDCNGNQIMLTDIVESDNTPVDWGFDVLNHVHSTALEYLSKVLLGNENVLVNVFRYKDNPTAYDIFYGCDAKFETPCEAAQWLIAHGGVVNNGHYYTETRDGKKTAIEF